MPNLPRQAASIPSYLTCLTLPTPFPVGPVNVYLALGNEPTLIDTGPKDSYTLAALRDQLAERGLAFKDIRRVIVTHAHVDHFGLAAQIVAESGAIVYSHPRNEGWLTDFENELGRRRDFYRAVFASSGAPSELNSGVGLGLQLMSQYGATIPAEKFIAIDEGDSIAMNGDPWRVFFTPGHANGLVCLYDPKSCTLLSNDHLLRDITSNPILEPAARGENERPRALVNYIASMKRTAELDVRIALPGHGEPIEDVRALVEERLAFHRARLDVIERYVQQGAATAYELKNALFPKAKSLDVFLGLSEVIGHLDVLEAEGRVARTEREGVWRYQ